MKLSNLPEEIYRERLNQIDKDEKEEIRFLKNDTIEKLCLNKVRFFDTFDGFLRLNFGNVAFQSEHFKDLQEMERQYKEKQLWVLDKLLVFSFFQKPDFVPAEIERERPPELAQRIASEMREADSERNRRISDQDREVLKTQINDSEYFGREKKLVGVKLTKYISTATDFSQTEKKNIGILAALPPEKVFKLTSGEVQKILTSRNHRNYYDEEELSAKSEALKEALFAINARVEAGEPDAKRLSADEVRMLMDAYLFSANSVHHVPNFEKKGYYISPSDVAFVVNKLR